MARGRLGCLCSRLSKQRCGGGRARADRRVGLDHTSPARLEAEDAVLPIWSNDVMKLEKKVIGLNGSPTHVRKIFAPQREKGEIIDGEGDKKDEAVQMMVDKLNEWDILTVD